jgi:hypothetical protein
VNAYRRWLDREFVLTAESEAEVVVLTQRRTFETVIEHNLAKCRKAVAHAAAAKPVHGVVSVSTRILTQGIASRSEYGPTLATIQHKEALEHQVLNTWLINYYTSEAHDGGIIQKAMLDGIEISGRHVRIIVDKVHHVDVKFTAYFDSLITLPRKA